MTAADDLRALSAAATPGPWTISHRCIDMTEMDDETCGLGLEIDQWDEPMRGHISLSADARLTAWLRNHADAIAGLIAAVRFMPTHGSDPGVSYCFICNNDAPCSTERVQVALAALDADT